MSVSADRDTASAFRQWTKRLFDVVAAVLLLVLMLPVMAVTALLVVLESPGAALFAQERVGLRGRTFNVFKFRSMRTDAEANGQPQWAVKNDARITRVGRFIRKTRIDELPQLVNVIRGDMSLVGPRPERPYFVAQLTQQIPDYELRHSVKPGITGLAQVRFHYGASVEDSAVKLRYDLRYIKHRSTLLDLRILLETVGVVVTGRGAV